MKIRRATLRDLDLLVRHRRGMFEAMGIGNAAQHRRADAFYRQWARSRIRNGTLFGFLAETREGHPAASGCVWLREEQPCPGARPGPVPYLMSMFTEPEHRGRGLAGRIVREAIRFARARRSWKFTLHASRMGRRIYERAGFTRSTEMVWRPDPKPQHSPDERI